MNRPEWNAADAYAYPLLIKNLLLAPASYNPDQEIVYKGEKRYTYRQFHERIRRLAGALLKMGIKQGDTVAVMDWDSHRYLEFFYAVPMIGAVLHTINIRLSPEQMVFTISHAEDTALFINAEFLPLLDHIKGRIDTIKYFVLMNDSSTPPEHPFKFTDEYENFIAAAEPVQDFPDFDENTRATTFYTTGTTGMPKGVFFSHRQLVLHTLSGLVSLSSNINQGSFNRNDVYMPLTPMFHVHAWGIPYMATMLGVKQVYPGKYAPDTLLKLIDQEKVTYSHCVPTIMHMLLKHPNSANVDLSHWKVIIGGAALPKALCLAAMQRGIDIYSGYGLSETCPILSIAQLTPEETALPAEEQAALRCRTGRPFALVHLRVVNDQFKDIPDDDLASGEVIARSPWLTPSYLKDKVNSDKLWAGGWLHTSDVAARNSRGSIRITDRLKDVIKVGGEWLSSLEIEDILISHPAVSEAAVIGQPNDRWGEVPLAFVVRKENQELTTRQLTGHMREFIDKGLIPGEAILLKAQFVDSLEKTSVGKVNKMALRDQYLK
ncbi:MAG TPA: long-chain fatty acid--CoA ligase [bacterium]|nr:long-chain fatty acid--CoA ligase [bacterium]HPR87445.1 long-chain fatty acid--CoA ligase [bacterium]